MNFIKSATQNLWHGFLSAGAWAFVWFVTFFIATSFVESMVKNKTGITVTAFALTITVVSGRVAKIISCAIGGDADFKHVFLLDERRMNSSPKHFRMIFSAISVITAVCLLYSAGESAIQAQKVMDSHFLFPYSSNFWYVIICLFVSQMVFSWPEPLVRNPSTASGAGVELSIPPI